MEDLVRNIEEVYHLMLEEALPPIAGNTSTVEIGLVIDRASIHKDELLKLWFLAEAQLPVRRADGSGDSALCVRSVFRVVGLAFRCGLLSRLLWGDRRFHLRVGAGNRLDLGLGVWIRSAHCSVGSGALS